MDTLNIVSSQVEREQKRMVYAKMRLLSKIVHGMSLKLMESEADGLGFELMFDPSCCYIIATGLTNKALTHYPDGNFNYYESAPIMHAEVVPVIHSHGFKAMHFYDTATDLWNIIVSPEAELDGDKDILALAREVQERVQGICRRRVMREDDRYCVVTTVSDRIGSYAELCNGFRQAYQLRLMDFFCMEPIVIDSVWCENRKKKVRRMDINQIVRLLESSVMNGEPETICCLIEALTARLHDSLDIQMVDDVGSVLRHHILTYENIVNPGGQQDEGNRRFSMECFPTLDAMMASVEEELVRYAEVVNRENRRVSTITKNAVQYIQAHFCENISQQEVAQAVGVVPQYLSSVFNREMSIGIPGYINNLRIREAQALLRNTDMKISEIAKHIGLMNTDAFYSLFKRIVGVSASTYRAQYTEEEIM